MPKSQETVLEPSSTSSRSRPVSLFVIGLGSESNYQTLLTHVPEWYATEPARLDERLFARLQALDPQVFERVLIEAASQKNRRLVPTLLELLTRSAPERAQPIAQAIATLGGRRACPGLIRVLEDATAPQIRAAAVYGLTWLLDPRGFATLYELFKQPGESPETRVLAGEGLTYLTAQYPVGAPRYQKAVSAFLSGLDDAEPQIQAWSATALGVLRARSALPKLHGIVRSGKSSPSYRSIQAEVREAIEQIEQS